MMDPEWTLSNAGETVAVLPDGYEWIGVRGGAWIFRHTESGLTGALTQCHRSVLPPQGWQGALDYQVAKLERARERLAA